ncbi:MAG: hypothetical protein AAF399_29290, partial [Bacteroidota bacterium]
MKESKLVQTFELLSASEQQDFAAFLERQPQITQEILRLCEWMLFQASQQKWNKKSAWRFACSPKQAWEEKKMRTLMSSLMRYLKQFLVELELQTEDALKEQLFLSQLRKRQGKEVFSRQMTVNLRNLHRRPFRDGDYYFARYAFASEANGLYGQQHIRKPDQNLQEKMHFLDAWYVGMKLKESCEMLNRQNVLATSFSNPLLPEVLKALEQQPDLFGEIPAIEVYHHIYRCLAEESRESFQSLVAILATKSSVFQFSRRRGRRAAGRT